MFDLSNICDPRECGVIVDAGAHRGGFLFAAIDYFQPERAVAIEMLDDLAEGLRNDARLAPHYVLHCALGDWKGEAPCWRSAHSEASSLLEIDPRASSWYGIDLQQTLYGSVRVRTLDDICEELRINSIDVLKIDVQGYTLPVIRGARRILQRTRRLIVEVEFVPVYQGQAVFDEVDATLRSLGMTRHGYLAKYVSQSGQLLHGDALYVARRRWSGVLSAARRDRLVRAGPDQVS